MTYFQDHGRVAVSKMQSRAVGSLRVLDDDKFVGTAAWHLPDAVLEKAGDPDPHARLVVSGWLGACRTLADGRRQVLHLLLPGDFCGQVGADGSASLVATVALTRARVADYGSIRDLRASRGSEQQAVLRRLDQAAKGLQPALLDQIVRLGRLSALERTAHLLLDLHRRLRRVGEMQGLSMPLPLTQEMLADHLGLSIVHMSRTLQKLRRDGLIDYRNGRVTLQDPHTLASMCSFDRTSEPWE